MREVAQDLGVSNESLRRWVQQTEIDEGRHTRITTEEGRWIREFRRKVRTLEQEREILNKAAAMIDRLVQHAEVVSLKGDSYRVKDRDLARLTPAVGRVIDAREKEDPLSRPIFGLLVS